jgi:hypothetical protein
VVLQKLKPLLVGSVPFLGSKSFFTINTPCVLLVLGVLVGTPKPNFTKSKIDFVWS